MSAFHCDSVSAQTKIHIIKLVFAKWDNIFALEIDSEEK